MSEKEVEIREPEPDKKEKHNISGKSFSKLI